MTEDLGPVSDQDIQDRHTRSASQPGRVGVAGWLAIGILLSLLAAAVWFAIDTWQSMDGVVMSVNGIIAMVLGIVLSLIVGAGLMALIFFSSRRGFDR